ncbi:hypothetical protein FOZ62_027032 [Perkinsus olseni]|uniref:Amino acid transporter transmembrane domain-containing protein n=1 Tax=Perkinsus olseni TaxID=32597 RepID=A0A7J6SEZ8_PEROL|nr:hypothetical protein FOZ62_027032 [Perkinsus olseni]
MASLFSDIPECGNTNLAKLYNLTNCRISGVQSTWLTEVASVARTAEFLNEQLMRLLIHAICYLKAPRGSVDALRTRTVTLEVLEEAFGFVLHCIHFESLGPARKIRPRLYNLPALLTACSTRAIEMGALLCLEGLVARMWPRPDVTLEISPSPCSQCNFMPSCGVSDGSCENCGARKRQSGKNRQYNERVCSRLQLRVHAEKRGDTDVIVEVSGEVGLHEARRGFKLGKLLRVVGTVDKEPVPLGELAGKQGPRTGFRLFLKAVYVWPFEPVPLLHYGVKCFSPSLRDVFLKKVVEATPAAVGPTRVSLLLLPYFLCITRSDHLFPNSQAVTSTKRRFRGSSNNPGMREHIRILLLQEPDNTSIWTEIVEALRDETGICLLESIEKLARAQLSGIVQDSTQTCTKGEQAVADQFLGVKIEAEVTCSVIATASVKYGRYDGSRTLVENMGPSAKVAASFDLVFSPPTLDISSTTGTSRIDRRVAIDYIRHVRSSSGRIELSKEGELYLNHMLGRLDEASQNNHMAEVTPPLTSALRRSALMRLCRACCRVELSEMIEVEHVKEALDIYMGNAMVRQDALTGSNPSEDGVELGSADAGCDGDVECEALISEANYIGFILKKAGNVYEYCRHRARISCLPSLWHTIDEKPILSYLEAHPRRKVNHQAAEYDCGEIMRCLARVTPLRLAESAASRRACNCRQSSTVVAQLIITMIEMEKEVVNETEAKHGMTTMRAAASLVMTAVGLGVLSMPRAFARVGWLGGFFCLFASCVVSGYCCIIFWRALSLDPEARGRPMASFEEVGRKSFGRLGVTVCGFLVNILLVCVCAALLVVMGESFLALTGALSRRAWISICGVINMPLSWIKHMKDVGLVAAIGELISQEAPAESELFPKNMLYFLYSFDTFLLSFTVGVTQPMIVAGMNSPTHFPKALALAFTFILVVYVVVSYVGYAAYGRVLDRDDSIILALCPPGVPLTITGWLLNITLLVLVAVHFVILIMPTAQLVDSVLKVDSFAQRTAFSWALRIDGAEWDQSGTA